MVSHTDEWLGPLDYLVVRISGDGAAQPGFDAVLALVDAGQIQVLDFELVERIPGGSRLISSAAVLGDLDLSAFEGAYSGLLDADDLVTAAESLQVGQIAAVLVYEVLVMHPVVAAFMNAGVSIVAEGPLTAGEVVGALDATDTVQGISSPSETEGVSRP